MRMSETIQDYRLGSAYNQLLSEIGPQLRFTPQDYQRAVQIPPTMWGYHAAVVFGEERATMPYRDPSHPQSRAMSLLAGDDELGGQLVHNFKTGEVAQRVESLREGTAVEREAAASFVETSAQWLFAVGAMHDFTGDRWKAFVPTMPQTYIKRHPQGKTQLVCRGQEDEVFLEGPIERITSFGPGLSVQKLAELASGRLKELQLVSGGKNGEFVDAYATNVATALGITFDQIRQLPIAAMPPYWRNQGVTPRNFINPRIESRAGGIAASEEHLRQRPAMDLVLMSAVHTAGTEECTAGVQIAAGRLRRGGYLAIAAPDQSLNDVGMDVMLPLATELFGSPRATGSIGKDGSKFTIHDVPMVDADPRGRSGSYAVFQKQ